MSRKKKNDKDELAIAKVINEVDDIVDEHEKELESNPEFSLQVDPLNKYNLTEEHRTFISYYCKFKNINFVQSMMGISTEEANAYFLKYASQQEIRRINRAMMQRQFHTKMLNINQIGGYLTSLITDENVALADRLTTKDKLNVVSTLIELNKLKAEAVQKPDVIDISETEKAVKEMSIDSIKLLLSNMRSNKQDNKDEKNKLINKLNVDNSLLPEEIDYLKSLSITELLKLLDTLNS